jgi:spore coat polysaccharide biosynthesis protein SpsF (cytidylyltransferase family)
MTLDYLEDFDFFKAVLETLYYQNKSFTLQDVIELHDSIPEIAAFSRARAEEWHKKHESFDIHIS